MSVIFNTVVIMHSTEPLPKEVTVVLIKPDAVASGHVDNIIAKVSNWFKNFLLDGCIIINSDLSVYDRFSDPIKILYQVSLQVLRS